MPRALAGASASKPSAAATSIALADAAAPPRRRRPITSTGATLHSRICEVIRGYSLMNDFPIA
jgi:hypothetical protein